MKLKKTIILFIAYYNIETIKCMEKREGKIFFEELNAQFDFKKFYSLTGYNFQENNKLSSIYIEESNEGKYITPERKFFKEGSLLHEEEEGPLQLYSSSLFSCSYHLEIIKKKINMFFDNNQSMKKNSGLSSFEDVSNEIIQLIINNLDPISILIFSYVSTRFKQFINDDFWERYNTQYNFHNLSAREPYCFKTCFYFNKPSPVKIMVVNYLYQVGRQTNNYEIIKKCANLGLVKAEKFVNKYKKNIRNYGLNDPCSSREMNNMNEPDFFNPYFYKGTDF